MEHEYITKEQLASELKVQEEHFENIVRERVMTAKVDLSKQLHRHITARFDKSKEERGEAHEELKKLITTSSEALMKKMNPIIKNYEAAGTMGKWLFAILTFITVTAVALANLKAGASQLVNFFK